MPLGGPNNCRREMISDIDISKNDRILDMCCGTGGITFSIARKAPDSCDIIGMDISKGQLEHAKRKNEFCNVSFVEKDVRQTGADPNTFDKVFITHSLHEMNRNDRCVVLSEAMRILKPDAKVVILELDRPDSPLLRSLAWFWFFYWLPFNFETPTRKDLLEHGLEREVKETGFSSVKKISKYKGMMQVVIGRKPKI